MRFLTLLFILALVFSGGQSYAQELSKDEVKAIKSELKQYRKDPAAFQQLKDEHRLYRKQSEDFERQLNALRSNQGMESDQLTRKQQEVAELNNQLMSAQATIQRLEDELARRPESTTMPPSTAKPNYMTGLVFRVQIGAYRKKAVPGQAQTSDQMTVESGDDMQKILIGNFRNYDEAKELGDYFKQIGLKDAWVVPYRDGQRITLKEALGTGN
jgi:flagellar biosynthesis GTPase FlhF